MKTLLEKKNLNLHAKIHLNQGQIEKIKGNFGAKIQIAMMKTFLEFEFSHQSWIIENYRKNTFEFSRQNTF